jgi:uncharacterized delta-60 repeat protein
MNVRFATRRIAAVACLLMSLAAAAAPELDRSFSADGIVIGPPVAAPGYSYAVEGLAVDRLDRVLFLSVTDLGRRTPVGSAFTNLMRLKANGDIDTTFGVRGTYPFMSLDIGHTPACAITLDSLGRIIVAEGYGGWVDLQRLTEDGLNEGTFGRVIVDSSGVPFANVSLYLEEPTNILDIAVQGDGKVLLVTGSHEPGSAAGTRKISLFRWTKDGTPDAEFGIGGQVFTAVPGGDSFDAGAGIALQPDGKIVVVGRSRRPHGGWDAFVARYLPTGTLDAAFGSAGITLAPWITDSTWARKPVIQPDGNILVAGTIFKASSGNGRAGLLRVKTNGAIDGGLGPLGWRVDALGGNDGQIRDIVLQADGKAVTVGYRNYLAGAGSLAAVTLRYTATGALDPAWSGDGRFEMTAPGFSDSLASSLAIDSLGRILVSGYQQMGADLRWFVARLVP